MAIGGTGTWYHGTSHHGRVTTTELAPKFSGQNLYPSKEKSSLHRKISQSICTANQFTQK